MTNCVQDLPGAFLWSQPSAQWKSHCSPGGLGSGGHVIHRQKYVCAAKVKGWEFFFVFFRAGGGEGGGEGGDGAAPL